MRIWLKNLRCDISQEEIASIVGISQQMYSSIERGERNPSVEVAKRIGEALHFPWTMFYDSSQDVRMSCKKDAS